MMGVTLMILRMGTPFNIGRSVGRGIEIGGQVRVIFGAACLVTARKIWTDRSGG